MPLRHTIRRHWPLAALAAGVLLLAPTLASAASHTSRGHSSTAGARPQSPIGAHSMLYLNTPYGAKQAMFAQAAEMGASEIRVDVELSAVFPEAAQPQQGPIGAVPSFPGGMDPLGQPSSQGGGPGDPDWSQLDQYLQLASEYHLRVLADLMSTPSYMADCPSGTPRSQSYRCPPKDPEEWAREAGEIALHTRGVIDDFEIINEPDRSWAFLGTPQQYAEILAASYDAIHAADPAAQVTLGGIGESGQAGRQWMETMLSTPDLDAVHKFDIANIHLRVRVTQVAGEVCAWRSYLASRGFDGPLWITETGYPADPARQTDPGFRGGAPAQARWLKAVIPTMLAAGAARVFVTERDWGTGAYASEGVLKTPDPLPPDPVITRRPSFYTVQRLARGAWTSAVRRARILGAGACPAG